jgi:pimeloyl-ACP methyl ester carboxylesterase
MRRTHLLGIVCSFAVLAGACTDGDEIGSTDSTIAAPTTASTALVGEPEDEPQDEEPDVVRTGGFEPNELQWSECDLFECATLEVPLDYSDPDGDRIDIAVIRSTTDAGDRIGSVVVNPGGPGASGVEYLRLASLLLPSELSARFDLVGFDPRGVGASSAIDCDLELDDSIILLEAGDDAGWQAVVADEESSLVGCEGDELAPFVGTNNAARDMDVLRQALGDEKLTYIGYSYGTRLGASYAELFPQNVRALVLDAAVLPDSDLNELEKAQAAGFDAALENFADACDEDADCILRDLGPTIEVFRSLEAEIADVGSFPVDGGRQLTQGEFVLAALTSLYSVESWPILAEGLFVADTLGDGTILQFLADSYLDRQPDGSYTNAGEANRFINCADDPNRLTLDDTRTAVASSAAQSVYFDDFFRSNTGCVFTPEARDPLLLGPAEGAPPILVIGNTGDPATPYQWSVALAESLSSGVLYTVEAEGHTAYGSFDCLEEDVTSYLVDLKVPETPGCSVNATADFFPPPGESQLDLLIGFFDCLIDEGVDIEPVTTSDILADPTGEALLERLDLADPALGGAILACQALLGDLL